MKSLSLALLIPFLFISFIGCSPASDFNETAYQQSISVKTRAVDLIGKSNEPYNDHREEIDSLKNEVETAYQFARTIPGNDETISQWEIIRDPNRSSLFGLLERWKAKTRLSDSFISQVRILIGADFDEIISFEYNKHKPSTN
jgi:hypothetical protein